MMCSYYKYTIPNRIQSAFDDLGLDGVTFNDRIFTKEVYDKLDNKKLTYNEFLDALKQKNVYVSDFEFIEEKKDLYEEQVEKLIKEVNDHPNEYLIINGGVQTLTFYITHIRMIYLIDDTCSTGILNDLKSYLKNKRSNIGLFEFKFQKQDEIEVEDVYKFYIYDTYFITTSSTGAGKLTKWLTQKEMENLILNNTNFTYIKLNTSKRLKKD